jgi:predicted transcriptional regulator
VEMRQVGLVTMAQATEYSLAREKLVESQEEQGVTFVTLYARIVNELAKNPRMAQETLARRLDVTMRTVQRHLTELEREGFVQVQRDRKPYTYEIAWERPLRYFDQLTVGMFRPDVLDELAQKNRTS